MEQLLHRESPAHQAVMWNSLAKKAKQRNGILLSMGYKITLSESWTDLEPVHGWFLWGPVSAAGAANLRRWTAAETRRCTAASWWPDADTFCLCLSPYSPWHAEYSPKPGAYRHTHTQTHEHKQFFSSDQSNGIYNPKTKEVLSMVRLMCAWYDRLAKNTKTYSMYRRSLQDN